MANCVLAYSGGLDTSVILGWLMDEGYQVHCVYVDLGQPCEDREAILQKARKIGAKSARIVDAREELCRDFAFPVLQWDAKYEGMYLLGHVDRPAADLEGLPASRPRGRGRHVRPRGHGQGERSVPLPVGRRGARSEGEADRPLADRKLPAEVPRPHRHDRLLPGEEDPGQGLGHQALQLRRELPAHQLRGGQAGGPAAERRRAGRVRHDRLAAKGPRQDREREDRLRGGRAGERQRRAAGRRSRWSPG